MLFTRIQTRLTKLLVGMAVTIAVSVSGGCASGSTPVGAPPPIVSTVRTSWPDYLGDDYLRQLESASLAPDENGGIPTTDAGLIGDAEGVCEQLQGDSTDAERTADVLNMRDMGAPPYHITPAQSGQVVLLSAKIYCPDRMPFIRAALATG